MVERQGIGILPALTEKHLRSSSETRVEHEKSCREMEDKSSI
jgi:hypothetical protein